MIIPDKPYNETDRLAALFSYSILDTLPEPDYDNLTSIAAQICGTPISLITLIDQNRQWFKSHHGLAVTETPRDFAFCAHAIHDPDNILIVNDAREDKRFHDNPLVTGEPHVIFYAGVPLVNEEGATLGTLCVIDDTPKELTLGQIDALKALSKQVISLLELRRKKVVLEKELEEKTQRVKVLEQFAFEAAHDLKSPLNNISNLTKFLLKDFGQELPPAGQQLIELISVSSEKLKGLINGLLTYSKAEALQKEKKSAVSLTTFLEEIKSVYSMDKKANIRLNTDMTEIITNRFAFEQIIRNLVSNAIRYNDKEVVEVEIGVFGNEKYYECYVQDNGLGIPKVYHKKIFRAFEILERKDRYGQYGHGIGLAIVEKAINSLGGAIGVSSEKGKGTRFTFTLER
ncbi:GAF domain-containing sensor histidine kinase [Limibacter armeniacum]|uniref:sensor histidine kinase n=1 Tax=Limibacter armeniacum TaxID=466084 RepID=UPI002FE52808